MTMCQIKNRVRTAILKNRDLNLNSEAGVDYLTDIIYHAIIDVPITSSNNEIHFHNEPFSDVVKTNDPTQQSFTFEASTKYPPPMP